MPIDHPYPISGVWVYGQAPGAWGGTLDEIHDLGASKILQFGSVLALKSEEQIKTEEPFKRCSIDGNHAYDLIKEKLRILSRDTSIKRIYTMDTMENFDDHLLSGILDRRIDIPDRIFWSLVVPSSSPEDVADPGKYNEFDLILVAGSQHDSLSELLAEATHRGLEVYVGMPMASPHPDRPWEVWEEAKPVFFELLNRVFASYRCSHYSEPSFAGLYQSFELQLSDPPDATVLSLYNEQHALARTILPRKKIVVSPYWEARKQKGGQEPDSVRRAFIQLAGAGEVDIIAPQDGRGVGKVGLFWPYQSSDPVPPELHPAVGSMSYGGAYHANTRDFFGACRDAVDKVLAERIELWANVEAFEPGPGVPCGSFSDIQRTKKND